MATTLSLLKDFATGNASGDIANYFTYANDLDTDFTAIEATVNQLIAELLAVQGPNAALFAEVLGLNDAGAYGPLQDGVVGQHSYEVAIGVPTTELDVATGVAIVNGIKVQLATPMSIVGPGGASAWHYVALDANGIPSIEVLPGQQALDVARVQWTTGAPGSYGGTIFQEAEIFFDGDEYAEMRRRPKTGDVTTPTFPARNASGGPPITVNAFRLFASRIRDIENILAGVKVGAEGGDTLGAIVAAGSAAAPGIASLYSGTYYLGTGIFPAGANVLGVSIAGTELLRFLASAVRANADGAVGAPFFSWVADPDTGMYRIGANELGIATAGALRVGLDPNGNIDLPTNARVQGSRTAFHDLTNNTATTLVFNAADSWDIGNGMDTWHNAGGGSPGDQEFTVPTGCDGLYHLLLEFDWEAATAAEHNLELYIMLNGVTIGANNIADWSTLAWGGTLLEGAEGSFGTYRMLAAGDVIRAVGRQNSAGAVNHGLDNYRLSIVKVA